MDAGAAKCHGPENSGMRRSRNLSNRVQEFRPLDSIAAYDSFLPLAPCRRELL